MPALLVPPRLVPSPLPLLTPRDAAIRLDLAERRGEVRRVARGVYVDDAGWSALPPWGRYLVRVHAAALTHPGATLFLESAAAVLGLPVLAEPEEVHLLTETGTARASGGVRIHQSRYPREVVEVDGLRVVSPTDTAIDIARSRHLAAGVAIFDALLRRSDAPTRDDLVKMNGDRPVGRGCGRASEAIASANPLAETPLESVSRCAATWLGYDEPLLQRQITTRDGRTQRVDMWWPHARVIGEADGAVKYDGTYGAPAEVVLAEKQRDRLLREHANVARWGWREVRDPRELDEALRAAGLVRRRLPRYALLATLPAAPAAAPAAER
ncbi:hypothetical protein QWJ90_06150 [Microbacterium oryzae]|uniref:hypothetical protein n=1 Tax=Microbacterium oryzae TaxID=743009 RepID=UPI0025AF175A|nr:hypothetical protein [Microbacterium oryzae]MDN3310505.1 hypothetical protein [Microbacterium oryzae]